MNSNEIRDLGFVKVLSDYPKQNVKQLLKFHQQNGGLSRYVKFRYFFEKVMGEDISEKEINIWAEKFSKIMKELLIDPSLLIHETIDFVKKEHKQREMHIVSGSDQDELRFICKNLQIEHYFNSINGSPTPKVQLVKSILERNNYTPGKSVLVGDSVNDLEAAEANNVNFIGFNYKD